MKLNKLICLDFKGDELEDDQYKELDTLTELRVSADLDVAKHEHSDADALLVKSDAKCDKTLIDTFPNLKYIGMFDTDYSGIDTTYAASKSITVTNVADYATESVAEFTFGILLEFLHDIAKARTQARAGNYSDDFISAEIRGKKFGVIGFGDIGARTANIAQAFGADVYYWSQTRNEDAEQSGIKYSELSALIANAHIITLDLELTPETKGIINAELINSFRHYAIVINPSPVELIDFTALAERLKKNDLIFMLDHSNELSQDQLKELQPLDNAIVYPSIAYLSREAGQLKKRIFADNIKNFLDGQPTNKVN